MKAFISVDSVVTPIDRNNVDTDALIPKQFLKSISRQGLGPFLFDEWRYLDRGELGQDCSRRPLRVDFPLNQPRYAGSEILLSRDNFGCGSSREHAVWALEEYGFRVVMASSFADIFFGNCFKCGLLPVVLASDVIERMMLSVLNTPGYRVHVDLQAQTVSTGDGQVLTFPVDEQRKRSLLDGLDEIGQTLKGAGKVRGYEQQRRLKEPWLFERMLG